MLAYSLATSVFRDEIKPGERDIAWVLGLFTAALFLLSIVLHEEIMNSLPDSWIGNTIKERAVKNVVKKYIQNPKKAESIFEIIKNQNEYK